MFWDGLCSLYKVKALLKIPTKADAAKIAKATFSLIRSSSTRAARESSKSKNKKIPGVLDQE